MEQVCRPSGPEFQCPLPPSGPTSSFTHPAQLPASGPLASLMLQCWAFPAPSPPLQALPCQLHTHTRTQIGTHFFLQPECPVQTSCRVALVMPPDAPLPALPFPCASGGGASRVLCTDGFADSRPCSEDQHCLHLIREDQRPRHWDRGTGLWRTIPG